MKKSTDIVSFGNYSYRSDNLAARFWVAIARDILTCFPVGAIWPWRSEGRSIQDLGLRCDIFWRRSLI